MIGVLPKIKRAIHMESKQTVLGVAALFGRVFWQSHNEEARDYARPRGIFKCMTFSAPLLRLLAANAVVISVTDALCFLATSCHFSRLRLPPPGGTEWFKTGINWPELVNEHYSLASVTCSCFYFERGTLRSAVSGPLAS